MEALMKEGGGGDHISVGVKMGRNIRPIPRRYLYLVPPGKRMKLKHLQQAIVSWAQQAEDIEIIINLFHTICNCMCKFMDFFSSSQISATKIW